MRKIKETEVMMDKHVHKVHQRQSVTVSLLAISLLAITIGCFGAVNIYGNNKTDGFNSGEITVTSCREKDWAWRVYSCKGDYFSTGGGMVERSDVSVMVFGREYKKGEIITDVYPPEFGSNQTTDYFVTGRERASVTYNMRWLFAVFIGLVTPLLTAVFILRSSKRKHSL
jgi:hypothetical protein